MNSELHRTIAPGNPWYELSGEQAEIVRLDATTSVNASVKFRDFDQDQYRARKTRLIVTPFGIAMKPEHGEVLIVWKKPVQQIGKTLFGWSCDENSCVVDRVSSRRFSKNVSFKT